MRVLLALGVATLAAAAACAAGSDQSTLTGSGGSGAGGSSSNGQGGLGGLGQGGGGGQPATVSEVFGHSSGTLYRLSPVTSAVTVVGAFNGCDSVIDIAVDKDSNIYGTSYQGLHRIDKNTANCTLVNADAGYPNSLSFVPEGTLEPDREVLVGYFQSEYVRIDPTSGQIQTIGGLSGGFASSGDIVSVKDGGTYLTVYGPGCSDCLVEVNPVTGDMIKNWGPVNHDQVFGLAFWGGTAYGFDNDGNLFAITFNQNDVSTQPIAIPNAPPGLSFWGAGSSTVVPLVPPE